MSVLQEMQQVIDEWAVRFARGDVDAAAAMYTEDSAVYSPYGPAAFGHAAVRQVHQSWMDSGETNKKLVVLDARADGDLGYSVVKYSGDYPQGDGSVFTETGYAVNVMRRGADGAWMFQISSLNSETPPLAPASE